MTKRSSGGIFEDKVRRFLVKYSSGQAYVKRGSFGNNKLLTKIPKEPDFFILDKNGNVKIAIECKYISDPMKDVRYWTLFSRGYVLLHILKLKYPKIKTILIFNVKNKDKMNYYTICKNAKLMFICLNKDKDKFKKNIRQS